MSLQMFTTAIDGEGCFPLFSFFLEIHRFPEICRRISITCSVP